MWLFLNDSFLSIVADRDGSNNLLVRARRSGDIKKVFPTAKPWEDSTADYRFRALLPRDVVAGKIAERVAAIAYPNFKDSVPETDRHNAYFQVWDIMYRWGRVPAGFAETLGADREE